jgi:hypothetical protein
VNGLLQWWIPGRWRRCCRRLHGVTVAPGGDDKVTRADEIGGASPAWFGRRTSAVGHGWEVDGRRRRFATGHTWVLALIRKNQFRCRG